MKTTNATTTLKDQLRSFGLNPRDWKLLPSRTPRVLVINRQNSHFSFEGEVDSSTHHPRWHSLTLRSL